MPVTPARAAREAERREVQKEESRMVNENKYTEFRLNCDSGSVGACTSLGEWFELMRNDFASAVDLYKPACYERQYSQACFNLGNTLSESQSSARYKYRQVWRVNRKVKCD